MQYGAVFPQLELPSDPFVIRDYAQAVESMGYQYIMAYDHVLGANPNRPSGWNGPYTYRESFQEPFVLFGYLAGLTEHIGFATGILILPQRQTALVAKQAAQVDVLSGGRLRLGVGIGWNAVEYEALGENFRDRGKRSEEQVQLLRALWTEKLVTFQGKHHTITDAGINPLPVQRPIPVWFGGMADATLDRVARLGDGWIPNPAPFERIRPMIDTLRERLGHYGRRAEGFGIDVRVSVKTQPQADWLPYLETWRGLGATHAGFNTMGVGLTSLEQHLDALRRFAATVGVGQA